MTGSQKQLQQLLNNRKGKKKENRGKKTGASLVTVEHNGNCLVQTTHEQQPSRRC